MKRGTRLVGAIRFWLILARSPNREVCYGHQKKLCCRILGVVIWFSLQVAIFNLGLPPRYDLAVLVQSAFLVLVGQGHPEMPENGVDRVAGGSNLGLGLEVP